MNKKLIYFLNTLAMFFWGMSFVWTKIALNTYSPISLIFIRLLLSFPILFIIDAILKNPLLIKNNDLYFFMGLAFFEPFLYFLGENFGIQYLSSAVASIIIATIPVITPIFSYLFYKEKLTKSIIIGLMMSLFGLSLIIFKKNLMLRYSSKGIMLMFLAVLSTMGYAVIVKKLSHKYNPLTILKYQNLFGTLYFLPLFLIFEIKTFIHIQPKTNVILSIICLSFLASSLSFVFYTLSIREIGMNLSSLMTNLIPIFTAIASYFILDEQFNLQKIIGMILVISGVFFEQIKNLKKLFIKSEPDFFRFS